MKDRDDKRGDVNVDKIRKRAEERFNSQAGGLSTLTLPEGVELFTPKKGMNRFDIIPYEVTSKNHPQVTPGELWYQRTFWTHRKIGVDEKTYVCPKKTLGKPCPICEEFEKLRKDPDAEDELVKSLRPKERELFNIVDRSKSGSGKVQIMEMSYHLFGKILEEELTEGKSENASFSSIKKGKTLEVRFGEESMGSYSFLEASRIDFVSREEPLEDEVLESVVNLDKALKVLTYEELEKLFHGSDVAEDKDEDEDDDDKDEKPSKKSSKKDDEDEDDEDDDKDEDEDEDDKPKSKKKASKEDDDEDEDEDEDDEDDEDDDKPTKKKCVACGGSGENSKGKECAICEGSGKVSTKKDEDEDQDDDDEDEDKPSKKKSSKTEDDEDDEEDDDEDEDEDEDDKPSKKSHRRN